MNVPTEAEIAAGMARGRKLLDDYSGFESAMVSDDVLRAFVTAVLTSAENVPVPSPAPHAPSS